MPALTPGIACVDPVGVGVGVGVGEFRPTQPTVAQTGIGSMFHFQMLNVYRCAVAFLALGYALASLGDGEMGGGLRCRSSSISPRVHTLLVRIVSMLTKMIG